MAQNRLTPLEDGNSAGRIAIIGAGPAGLAAAYTLAKKGQKVDVYEASPHIGGMARSFELWNQTVDLGPHRFFSTDPRINEFWLETLGEDFRMVDRNTRIYYKKRFFNYPLQAVNALKNMGIFNALGCLLSYLIGRIGERTQKADTFENWVVDRFGRKLFEMFFKSYSEKLWGISCQELDSDFAAQRIKKFSLGEAVKTTLGWGKKKHKTLVDQFAYPTKGSGMPYEKMAAYVEENGGTINLQTPIRGVIQSDKTVTGLVLANGEKIDYDHVVSSMPITHLVRSLSQPDHPIRQSADALTFRNTIIVYLHIEGELDFEDQWLYIHSPDLNVGRITNFKNWIPEICKGQPNTILALEYWCYDEDAVWTESESSTIERAKAELAKTGLLGENQVLDGHLEKVSRCYPVYKVGYEEHISAVEAYLKDFENLTPIGRYGAFKYNNQDHSILMGILAAENIMDSQSAHDLWKINTDYDYQESSRIDENGLVLDDCQKQNRLDELDEASKAADPKLN